MISMRTIWSIFHKVKEEGRFSKESLRAAFTWKKIVRDLLIIGFILVTVLAGYERYVTSQFIDMKRDGKKAVATVDGHAIRVKDLSYYTLLEERVVEKQAMIYNPDSTKDYWNIRMDGKIMSTLVKRTILGNTIHDYLFYEEAKKADITLTAEEQEYLKNAQTDFWEDLLDQQWERLPASEDYINEQIRRAAIVQKYQRQLANEMGVTEASLNWDGYEYSKILKKHSVRNHKKVLDRLRVSELTIHHDTFNIINGLGKKN